MWSHKRPDSSNKKHKFTKNDFIVAIKHLIKIIQNQHNKHCNIITTSDLLHCNNARERQGLKAFQDQQGKIMRKTEKETIKFML